MANENSTLDNQLDRAIDRFWETFPPIWNVVRGHGRALAADHFDLTFEQFHILRQVRKGINTISGLAEIKRISRPAISQAVNVLVDKGLISRRESTEDRRFVFLDLTPDGHDVINRLFAQNRSWMRGKMASLTPAEIGTLVKGLELLKQIFVEHKV